MHDINVGLFRRDLWACRGGQRKYYVWYATMTPIIVTIFVSAAGLPVNLEK